MNTLHSGCGGPLRFYAKMNVLSAECGRCGAIWRRPSVPQFPPVHWVRPEDYGYQKEADDEQPLRTT